MGISYDALTIYGLELGIKEIEGEFKWLDDTLGTSYNKNITQEVLYCAESGEIVDIEVFDDDYCYDFNDSDVRIFGIKIADTGEVRSRGAMSKVEPITADIVKRFKALADKYGIVSTPSVYTILRS